jgi:hypothetical protein
VRQVAQTMPFPGPQVAVERLGGLAADRQHPGPAALAEHPHDPLVQVDVVQRHAGALGPAHAGVHQEQNDGRVAAASEVATSQVLSGRAMCADPTTSTGCSGNCGGLILSIGLVSRSPSATAHLRKACRVRRKLRLRTRR